MKSLAATCPVSALALHVLPGALAAASYAWIEFQAQIDGHSPLHLQGNTVRWQNVSYTVPGKHEGDYPTRFDPGGGFFEWWLTWPSGT